MTRGETAKQYFKSGCNCSQAVAMAFCDKTGIDPQTTARIVSGYGAGMGRMREVCGAMSGIVFVLSCIYGTNPSDPPPKKTQLYKYIQQLGEKFKADNGSVVCRELLGLQKQGFDSPVPEQRTSAYYKKRPCPELVEYAADILDEFLQSQDAPE